MGKSFLVVVDLEGIHGVVGAPYEHLLAGKPDYDKSIENAIKETNAVVKGLFDGGASFVAVWDCHWLGKNMDFKKIDSRAVRVQHTALQKYVRFSFTENYSYDGVLFVGYHAHDGSLNGVLSHTYDGIEIQYFKINGQRVGEFEMDSYLAGDLNIPVLFCASDDVCNKQALSLQPKINSVITKVGTGRNSAIFRDEKEVLDELYEKVKKCVNTSIEPIILKYPAQIEVRFTRSENALKKLDFVRSYGIDACFGEDTHIVVGTLRNGQDLESFIQ